MPIQSVNIYIVNTVVVNNFVTEYFMLSNILFIYQLHHGVVKSGIKYTTHSVNM